jgi:hypothetical protein
MYRLGKRKKRSKKLVIIGSVLLIVALAGWRIDHYVQNSTKISASPASVRYLNVGSTQKKHFDEGIFSVDLPRDWKLVNHDTPPVSAYNIYTFQGTTAAESSRLIAIYQDTLPAAMAVNRVVSVQAQGYGMSHGTVSDNCVNFTSDAARNTPEAISKQVAASRWDGVDFLCDLANYNRNVTGISAADSINKVTLTGAQSGVHSFFILFTDTNINPDYTVLYNTLDSFKLK